jgi:hypothetical protein
MQVKTLALELPSNDLDRLGEVPGAFPESRNTKKEVLQRIAGELLSGGPTANIALPPPVQVVG